MKKQYDEIKGKKTGCIAIVALIVSMFALCWNITWSIVLEQARNRAQIEVWERRIFHEGVEYKAKPDVRATPVTPQPDLRPTPVTPHSGDNRTEIILVIRNLSQRPTAIIHIYAKEKEAVLGDYIDQIGGPIRIEPWGLKKESFRMESNVEKRMTDIIIEDMDSNKIDLPSGPHRQAGWNKIKFKKSIFKTLYDFVLDL
jgi:hypothetical protein